jgi:DMSO reductase anchor subunit
MKPAFSVIFLTTLIGLAQGLFLSIALIHADHAFLAIDIKENLNFFIYGSALSLLLLVAGLLASFFHLGHPERAWRSAAKWKTSWLSREVIVLPAVIGSIFLYATVLYFDLDQVILTLYSTPITISLFLALASIFLIFTLFICTGMIYACIKFIQEWHSSLTVINYTLFGISSGTLLAATFSIKYLPAYTQNLTIAAIVILVLTMITRGLSLVRNKSLKPISTPQSAIGVRAEKIKLISSGADTGSFNTREFFSGKSKEFTTAIKAIAIGFVLILPLTLMLIFISIPASELLHIAVFVQYIGLMAERWYFFAQANHPQNIYYANT